MAFGLYFIETLINGFIYANHIPMYSFPDGLGVRIPGFHPGGPGSIPGLGEILLATDF